MGGEAGCRQTGRPARSQPEKALDGGIVVRNEFSPLKLLRASA